MIWVYDNRASGLTFTFVPHVADSGADLSDQAEGHVQRAARVRGLSLLRVALVPGLRSGLLHSNPLPATTASSQATPHRRCTTVVGAVSTEARVSVDVLGTRSGKVGRIGHAIARSHSEQNLLLFIKMVQPIFVLLL